MVLIKVLLISSLLMILYQDVKERKVYWFLFPICALLFAVLYYTKTMQTAFYTSVIVNLCFVCVLLATVFLYAKYKLKSNLFKVFGQGDLLLFLGLVFTFASVSFIVIFISALIFSLILHLFIDKKESSVPLAGYMSLFFGLTYVAHWTGFINSLYSI